MDQVIDNRQPGFYWVDNHVLVAYAGRIKPHGIAIYSALCMHAGRSQTTHVSLDTLRAETGIDTKESVLKYLAVLQEVGLIRITRRPGRAGNVYQILDVFSNAGAVRPSKPSARIVGDVPAKPVKEAVDKSAKPVDKSATSGQGMVGVTDHSEKNGRRNRPLPDAEMVGVTDHSGDKWSATPTGTRENIDTIVRIEKDDDRRARAGKSSSSPDLTRPDLEEKYGERAVKMALEIAETAGKPGSLRYARGVLRNWEREGTTPRRARGTDPYAWEPVNETDAAEFVSITDDQEGEHGT